MAGSRASRSSLFAALLVILASLVVPASPARAVATRRASLGGLPPVMLWAWARPDDLRGLPSGEAGVAFLAATVTLGGEDVRIEPRRHPLDVDPETPLMAVVRIETARERRPVFVPDRTARLAAELAGLASRAGARALQIDFDATSSERGFYRDLIGRTREALGTTPLSITALASWCAFDDWLADVAVDEAVAMLFRLGPDEYSSLRAMGAAGTLPANTCAGAAGIATDEPLPIRPAGRRIYVFHPRGWTPSSARAAIAALGAR